MADRPDGYYWIYNTERSGEASVAQWSDGEWSFIGSVWLIPDDETDEDGERVMARYRIGPRIAEPADIDVALAVAEDRREFILGQYGERVEVTQIRTPSR